MVLEDITIKLSRYGGISKPSYSLTLKGSGELIYIGFENVKMKGKIKGHLSEDDFLEILGIFKDIDFFSYKDNFTVKKSSEQPYTNLSITIPLGSDNLKTTSITHMENDKKVPRDLIKLEEKIDEIVNSNRWIGKEKKVKYKTKPKLLKKILALILTVSFLSIAFFSYPYFLDFFNLQENQSNDADYPKINPEISYLSPTKFNKGVNNQKSPNHNVFKKGDSIYIEYEVSNISNDTQFNYLIDLSVKNNNIILYQNISTFNHNFDYQIQKIITNNSWPKSKNYIISLNLYDQTRKKSYNKKSYFSLYDINDSIPNIEITANPTNGYNPLNVSFNANLNNFSEKIISYNWNFGDENQSNVKNTYNIFSKTGNYSTSLTVTDENNNKISDIIEIKVIKSDFQGEPLRAKIEELEISDNQTLNYKANASGGTGFYQYNWIFWDQDDTIISTAEGKTGSYTFERYQYIRVVLFVDDGDSEDSYTQIIYIT